MGLSMESMVPSSTAGLYEGNNVIWVLSAVFTGKIHMQSGIPQSLGEGVIRQQCGKHSHSHTIKRETDN